MATSLERINSIERVKQVDAVYLERIPKRLEQISIRDVEGHKSVEWWSRSENSRSKLESLDSQRIMTVFDESIRKIEFVTLLPYILENLNTFQHILGKEIVEEIKTYDNLEQCYTQVLSRARRKSFSIESQISVSSNDSENDNQSSQSIGTTSSASEHVMLVDVSQELKTIRHHLKQSLKCLIRLFRKNPSVMTIIENRNEERASETNSFINKLNLYKDIMRLKLCTSQEQETKRKRRSNILINKQKRTQIIIDKLEAELQELQDSSNAEISKRNTQIKSLQISIEDVEHLASSLNEKVMSEAVKTEAAELKSFETKRSKYQQDVLTLKQTFQSTVESHRESELAWRKKKFKMETEVENWIAKYDADMGERQDELEKLLLAHKDEQSQLEELGKHFEIMKKDYLEIIEERRIAMEKREEAERLLQRMVQAAIVIQSMWRSYKCRKALKGKKKGKKGKGKKGKGRK